jgi:RNA polymerase sigma factor (TIGR02999 family)
VSEVTILLLEARQGSSDAISRLFELIHPELKRIARYRLRRDDGGTYLNTTALVNECYLKLSGADQLAPQDRAHFLSYAAAAMRSIVVDAARARLAGRRGGGERPVTLDSAVVATASSGEEEVLHVHEALGELAALEPRLARVVEMRYFGGMTDEEIGQALELSAKTVRRDWDKARMILTSSLRGQGTR